MFHLLVVKVDKIKNLTDYNRKRIWEEVIQVTYIYIYMTSLKISKGFIRIRKPKNDRKCHGQWKKDK